MSTRHRQEQQGPVSEQFTLNVVLALGFLAVGIGVLAAHESPASGYELSIYAATPLLFWVSVAGAFVLALVAGLVARTWGHRVTAITLGSLAALATASLPVIRGYAWYGTADSLSHLGWTRQVFDGRFDLLGLVYPGVHGIGMFLHATTGLSLRHALLLVVVVFLALFFVYVPVLTGMVWRNPIGIVFASFTAFLLLPINGISAHMTVHPSTMAVLFLPFVLVMVIYYLRDSPSPQLTMTGGLLAVSSTAMMLLHPQQAVNLFLLLLAIIGLSTLGAALRDDVPGFVTRLRQYRSIMFQTAFLGVIIVLWSFLHARIVGTVESLVSLLLIGGEPSVITQRSDSLSAIGASLPELFVKLFLAPSVYVVLAGILAFVLLNRRLADTVERDVSWLVAGLVPVGGLFVAFVAINFGTMYFRQLGFMMAVVSVLGALTIVYLAELAQQSFPKQMVKRVGAIVVVGLLLITALSFGSLFPSPYIYQPNMHVSDQQFAGYEATFETQVPGVEVYGIREGPDRFRDAIEGTGVLDSTGSRAARGVPGPVVAAGNLTERYDSGYVIVTEFDRAREVDAFRELRYDAESLNAVGDEPGVDHIRSLGDFDLYYIDS